MSERARAAIWGHLVGDAIGVPYEFSQPNPDRVVEVRQFGMHHQPAGTWSDDGALMLALLDSLTSVKFDPADQAQRMLAWFDEAAYTPDGEGAFDIGATTRAALDRLRRGVPAIDAGGDADRDQGNGSLMRILPVALVGTAQDGVRVERAHHASRVTHAHPVCQVACALYVLVADELLADPTVPADTALDHAIARLRAVYADDHVAFVPVLEELLAHRAMLRRAGGGWVLDSFWSAWGALAGATSYRHAIERAVRLGHDTDTTASIAGGLAGLRWGMTEATGGIPAEWLEALRGTELVEPLVARLD
jgi:ADP-ribosylglycohydrolase